MSGISQRRTMTIVRFYRKAGIYLYPIKSLEMRAVLKKEPGCLHPSLCGTQLLHVKKNTVLFEEGEKLDYFFVLKEGACLLRKSGVRGESRIVRILGPGDIMGKKAFFTGEGSHFLATALTDSTLVVYRLKDLKQSMLDHPDICHDLMGTF